MKEIKVMYHDKDMPKLENIGGINHSVAIDLYTAEKVTLDAGEFAIISLGVSIKVPEGHKADVKPRSSTFKKFGIIQPNSPGLIDEVYSGPEDIWKMPVFAPLGKGDMVSMMADILYKVHAGDVKTTFKDANEMKRWIYDNVDCRTITIPKHTRLCQMEILPRMEAMEIVETDLSGEKNRGGFGEGTDGIKN